MENETSYNTTTSNEGFNFASALKLRLDTSQIIENIEMFLRSLVIRYKKDENGQLYPSQEQQGDPLINEQGTRVVLNWIQTTINQAVVQGNKTIDDYRDYVAEFREDFTRLLVLNSYKWDIMDEHLEAIINAVLNLVDPFVSRLIDNKERESYAQTMKSIENNTLKEGRGFSLFNRGGN